MTPSDWPAEAKECAFATASASNEKAGCQKEKKLSAASYERKLERQLERQRKQAKASKASTGFATSASQLEKRRRIVVCCCSKCGPAGREQKYSTAAYHKSMDKKRLAGGQAGAKGRKAR